MADTCDRAFLDAYCARRGKDFLVTASDTSLSAISYRSAARTILDCAVALEQGGVGEGDCVVGYSDDTFSSLFFMIGAAFVGAWWCPLSPIFSSSYLADIVERLEKDNHPTSIFVSEATPLDLAMRSGRYVFSIDDLGVRNDRYRFVLPGTADDETVERRLRTYAAGHSGNACVVVPTSGSTGKARLVVRKQASIFVAADILASTMQATLDGPQEVLLNNFSMTHSAGLGGAALGLQIGARFALPSKLDADASLEEVRRLAPSILLQSPRAYIAMYESYQAETDNERSRWFGSALRVCLGAGRRFPDELMTTLCQDGVDVIDMYGSSETGVVSVSPPGSRRPGYSGVVCKNADVATADDGELLVRSPSTQFEYYLGDEEATKQALTESGFVRTGDIGHVEPDGWLCIRGRKADCFNTADGSNIFPERIESRIAELEGVRQAVMVGHTRPWNCALIFLSSSASADRAVSQRGFLPPLENKAVYEPIRVALQQLNLELEAPERLKTFALFEGEIDSSVVSAKAIKSRFNRKAFEERYADYLSLLYAEGPDSLPFAV